MNRSNPLDETAAKRALLTVLLTVGAIVLPFLAIRSANQMTMLVVAMIPMLIWLFMNPTVLLLTMMLVSQAKLTPLGFPGQLTMAHLLQIGIIGWWLIHSALKKGRSAGADLPGRFLAVFFLNMLLLIGVRGFGLSMAGSGTYGGAAYLYLGVNLLFYFAASRIDLKEKHLKILFYGGLLASMIPFAAQVGIYKGGEAALFLSTFIDVPISSVIQNWDADAMRWSELGNIAMLLMTICFVVPYFRRRRILSWALIVVAIIMILLTGFRGRLIAMAAIIFMWSMYDSADRMKTFFILLLAAVMGWFIAVIAMPGLPGAVQRSLSFLPYAAERITDQTILMGAQSSLDFRLDIWRIAWANAHRFLLIGRGLTLEVAEWAWLSPHWYRTPEFYYESHAYHSGPLGLLLDTGLLGMISALGFMISVCVKGWQGVRRFCVKRNDLIGHYYAFMVIRFTYSVIGYFLIFGDVRESIPQMILNAVIIGIFYRELARQQAAMAPAAEKQNATL